MFYCMFGEKVVSLPLLQIWFSVVRNKLLNSDQKYLINPYPLYLISINELHISLSLVGKYLLEVTS